MGESREGREDEEGENWTRIEVGKVKGEGSKERGNGRREGR